MLIRRECPADVAAIAGLVSLSFRTARHSQGNEALIVDALRTSGALTLSLVAVDENQIVGHAAFSPVTIDRIDTGWLGLGPVAVQADRRLSFRGPAPAGVVNYHDAFSSAV